MKKTATILLTLIVLFCLVPGAFAEDGKGKYMVLYIEVDTGNIAAVYASDVVVNLSAKTESEVNVPVKKPKHHTADGTSNGTPKAITDEISRTTYTTIFAVSSPGCRYIWYNGHYVKVCN